MTALNTALKFGYGQWRFSSLQYITQRDALVTHVRAGLLRHVNENKVLPLDYIAGMSLVSWPS